MSATTPATVDDIHAYTISVPDSKLHRLKQKLALLDLPDELPGQADSWARGPPLADIQRLSIYWRDDFDWRQAEARLNNLLPQFTTTIDVDGFGQYDIHFVHARSDCGNAIPLLFAHGWPGSFIEVTKVLPLLTQGGKEWPAFHVVAPSMVDFGFSGTAGKTNFQMDQHAECFHKLMLKLGYSQYVIQGGDLGYLTARLMSQKFPGSVRAQHLNNALPAEPTATSHPHLHARLSAHIKDDFELAAEARTGWFLTQGSAYSSLQQTRPQTLAYALASSPVALLAWVYEKLHDWTDGYAWTDDEVLTWVSIYEFSTAGSWASVRIYYEDAHCVKHPDIETRERENPKKSAFVTSSDYTDVKLGVSRFPKDLVLLPKAWHETLGPVVLMKEHDRGGHFAAWEVPELLVGDVREMFGKGGGAYGVVEGYDGYY